MNTEVKIKNGSTSIVTVDKDKRHIKLKTSDKYLPNNIDIELTNIDGTATASDIRSGKTGYVNGTQVTGSLDTYNNGYTRIVSIAVTTPPTKIDYIEGELLDYTGMVVTATYADSSTRILTNYTSIPANGAQLGENDTKITITYDELTCEQNLNVAPLYRIGGQIFYIHNDNGAIYTFFDADMNILSSQTVEGLQNAKYYLMEGTPSADKFYVVNTAIGLGSGWNQYAEAADTSSYNYIGGGKLASTLMLASQVGYTDSIWYWLKNTVNAEDNITECTDWYIGSAVNDTSSTDTNNELSQLKIAIETYPTIFSDQSTWFTGQLWSSTSDTGWPAYKKILWYSTSWYGHYAAQIMSYKYPVCAIRSF